jgi:hypothetical protein
MKTYQDLLGIGEAEAKRIEFVLAAINEYKGSNIYREGVVAYEYAKHRNVTIGQYQKLLYTVQGKAVPDNYSANWKMASNFFHRFVTQEMQYLLGNGITWVNEDTAEALGGQFDIQLQKAGKNALIGGVAFGFWNLDHLEVFKVTEFVPLYDEENGALCAGIRFWQLAADKPMRATLYELDGYTEYMWNASKGTVLKEKRGYVELSRTSEADGTEIYDYENYPGFPIVPLWGNPNHQSELVGLREAIDCYDLIKSGFANDLDDASQIYWIIQNAGGMDDVDLAKFIERMKVVHAAVVEDQGAKAEAHTVEVPYASREALLERISGDLYRDAMALDTKQIAGGAVTATQIRAAYEPLNSKTDEFEYCVHEFLDGILELAGITDEAPSFTRSMMINRSEEIQSVLQAATALDGDYVTRKLLTILGDGDKADEMIEKLHAEELNRFDQGTEE